MTYRLLILENKLPFPVLGLDDFKAWLKRNTGADLNLTVKKTDEVIGLYKSDRGVSPMSTAEIVQKHCKPGQFEQVVLLWDATMAGNPIATTGYSPLLDYIITDIPTRKDWTGRNGLFWILTHEVFHGWIAKLRHLKLPVSDSMDVGIGTAGWEAREADIENPAGNRALHLTQIRPYFDRLFRQPVAPPNQPNKPDKIIVHHTAVSRKKAPLQFKATDDYHKQQFNFKSSLGYYGGYHLFIEPNGTILRFRKDTEEGAHTIGQNRSSLAVCLTGNFDVEMPTPAQIDALRGVLSKWRASYGPLPIFSHRKYASYKSCYGALLSDDWASMLLDPIMPSDPMKEERFKQYSAILEAARQFLLKLSQRYQ